MRQEPRLMWPIAAASASFNLCAPADVGAFPSRNRHYSACFSIVSEVGAPPVYDASRRDDADRGNSAIVSGLRIPGDASPASRRPRLRPSCGDELGTRQFEELARHGYEPLALGAPVLMRLGEN